MRLPSEGWCGTLLVGHRRARIIGLHRRLQLGRIDFLALSPFDQVDGSVRRVGSPSLEPSLRELPVFHCRTPN